MAKTLKKYTTSEGNELEFYTVEHFPNTIIVRDNSCQLERRYTIGTRRPLSFSDYDLISIDMPLIESFDQVIEAWVSEKLHF